LAGQQPERPSNWLQQIWQKLRYPTHTGITGVPILGNVPGAAQYLVEQGLAPQSVVEEYQANLPSAGEQATGYDAAYAEAMKRAKEFSDPLNTIEAAAGHVMVSLENGYSPPFIMYEVQSHWGWSDADMKAAGYVRGLGGWTLDLGGGDVATATGTSGDGGGGGVSWSLPSLGGSRNSYASSSLINWRI
jgi:hypothetical protein